MRHWLWPNVPAEPSSSQASKLDGGYFGHFADPDGNIWEVAMASD